MLVKQIDINKFLRDNSEEKFKDFSTALIPNVQNMLGVRIPKLRTLAKELIKGDWKIYLQNLRDDSFEEVLLQGFIIAAAPMSIEERLPLIRNYVPKINNWALCDCFCSTVKYSKDSKDELWNFIQPYLKSDSEYELRFGVVMILDHFIAEERLAVIFAIFDSITNQSYYVQMGLAWTISVCYVKYPEQTWQYLQKNQLSKAVQNKSIQKIRESLRVSKEDKEKLKALKR